MRTKQLLEKQNKDLRIRLENMAPKHEMRQKDETIKKLQSAIRTLEDSMEDRIRVAVAKAVAEAVAPLREELAKAHAEIARLKSIINKDSSNSSKPPSTNGYKVIPNNRERSGRAQGGQPGHPGHRLSLPENMDELVAKGQVERRVKDNTNGAREYVSRFTIDVETKVIITEHRFARGEVPEGMQNEVSYGEGIKAQALLLMNEGIIAHKRLGGIISGMTRNAVNISTGSLQKFQWDFAKQLTVSGELEAIKQDLLNGEVMNTDDTTLRTLKKIVYPENTETDGQPKPPTLETGEKRSLRATLRTHSNQRSTIYTVNPKKDKEGIERDGILPQYMGVLCHDHESKFFGYGKANACCGSHLTRDLKGLAGSFNCSFAESMRKFLLGMNAHKNNDLPREVVACDPDRLSGFEAEYDRLLEAGRAELEGLDGLGSNELNAILKRLAGSKDNYMLFMRDYKVPFTNNLAERDLRPEKTKEKVSGLFRSWEGIVNHAKVMSFFSTAKKRGMDLFDCICRVMNKSPVFVNA